MKIRVGFSQGLSKVIEVNKDFNSKEENSLVISVG